MGYSPLVLSYGDDFAMIRHYLDVGSTEVPDATIEEYGYLPYVEAQVTGVITTYATILSGGGADMYRLKVGVAAWVAGLLCGKMAAMYGQAVQIGDYAEQASKVDWVNKARELAGIAAEALGSISTRTRSRMSLLALAGPTRSGGLVPTSAEQWFERIQPRLFDWIEEGGAEDD